MHRPALFLLSLAFLGCSARPPVAVPIVGPDGVPMLHVSCEANEASCYRIAGQYCPTGYAIDATPGGNFLVRCRAPAPAWSPRPVSAALAPSPYAIQETVQPWPTKPEPLAPSPYPPLRPGPPAELDKSDPYTPPARDPALDRSDPYGRDLGF